jgi:DNA topoisomerase-1
MIDTDKYGWGDGDVIVLSVEKINPCHTPSGSKGGQFCSTGGGTQSGMVAAPSDRSKWPEHIKGLQVPPAWKDVKINPDPKAALQVIGKDAAGRAQYMYSKSFQESQSAAKFARIKELDTKFDKIRQENQRNMKSDDPRVREHAECASLIMSMGVRPGSDTDTGAKVKAYGATTLLGKHVVEDGGQVRLQFTGKKGVNLNLPVEDRGLVSILKQRAARSGADGPLFPQISGSSLLDYTHTLNGGKFKTKDFRTLTGTREAMNQMKNMKPPTNAKEYKKSVLNVAKTVATKLGNTPTVALQSYIHPAVFSAWRASSAI